MNNKLEVFNNNELGSVRVVMQDDEPYFVAKDVCVILGYRDIYNLVMMLDLEDTCFVDVVINNENQTIRVINESGLYLAILNSDKPQAKQFKKWIISEVLPTIRKTNDDMFIENYLPFADDTTKLLFKQTLQVINEQNKKIKEQSKVINNQQQVIEVQKPKAEYFDTLVDRKLLTTIKDIAKELGIK